jgi:hypothetical protein
MQTLHVSQRTSPGVIAKFHLIHLWIVKRHTLANLPNPIHPALNDARLEGVVIDRSKFFLWFQVAAPSFDRHTIDDLKNLDYRRCDHQFTQLSRLYDGGAKRRFRVVPWVMDDNFAAIEWA